MEVSFFLISVCDIAYEEEYYIYAKENTLFLKSNFSRVAYGVYFVLNILKFMRAER